MNFIKIDSLKKTIKSFDIILCTTNSQFSSLINSSQMFINGRGKYTHVALCVKGCDLPNEFIFNDKNSKKNYKIDNNEIYLLESVVNTELESKNIFAEHFNGVQLRKFNETFEKYFELKKQGIFTELAHASLNMNYHPRSQYVSKIIEKYLGTKYNNSLIDKLYVPFRNNPIVYCTKITKDLIYGTSIDNNGILCTTLTCNVLKDIGIIDPDINANTLLPEDFVYVTKSSKMNKFKQIYLEPVDIIE